MDDQDNSNIQINRLIAAKSFGKKICKNSYDQHEGKWGRYLDVDGDGIPYRTIPGNQHPIVPISPAEQDTMNIAQYSEDAQVWEKGLNRIIKEIRKCAGILFQNLLMNNPSR